jgi:hypothetical protein
MPSVTEVTEITNNQAWQTADLSITIADKCRMQTNHPRTHRTVAAEAKSLPHVHCQAFEWREVIVDEDGHARWAWIVHSPRRLIKMKHRIDHPIRVIKLKIISDKRV